MALDKINADYSVSRDLIQSTTWLNLFVGIYFSSVKLWSWNTGRVQKAVNRLIYFDFIYDHLLRNLVCVPHLFSFRSFALAGDEIATVDMCTEQWATLSSVTFKFKSLMYEIIIVNSGGSLLIQVFITYTSIYIHHLVGKFTIMNSHKRNKFNWLLLPSRSLSRDWNSFAIKLI